MDDLIAFLNARLDEDERIAQGARPDYFTVEVLGIFSAVGDMRHAIRHDPARVLADVAAKRAIIADLTGYTQQGIFDEPAMWHREGHNYARFKVLCRLAQPYAEHPDYDQRWTPRWRTT